MNGPVGLANWKDYCYDLSGSDTYTQLTSDDYALKEGDTVYGIAYVIESYGIITNKTLLEKAGYTLEDIQSFEDLKKVAEDITSRKDELGLPRLPARAWTAAPTGASRPIWPTCPFTLNIRKMASAPPTPSRAHIWTITRPSGICISTTAPASPVSCPPKPATTPAMSFLAGEAVFFQNGSWEYGNLTGEGKYTDDDLAMIPIYIGVGDEANQGLCTGTENYWCVNKEASEDDIQATLDFINWCVTSEQGTKAMADDMGFVIPFKTAQESPNLFVKQDAEMTAAGKTPVSWNFTTMPSEEWKNGVGSALTAYAAGTGDWNGVVSAFVDGWASEAALNAA